MTWRDELRPAVETVIRRLRAELPPETSLAVIRRRANAAAPHWVNMSRGGHLARIWRSEVRRQLDLGPTRLQAIRQAEAAAQRERSAIERDECSGQLRLFGSGER